MAFTGKIGSSASMAGNVVPALGSSPPPPPPPPPPPTAMHRLPGRPNAIAGTVPTGLPRPYLLRAQPIDPPATQLISAAAARQIVATAPGIFSPVPGPWRQAGFVPVFQYRSWFYSTPPAVPPVPVLAPVNPIGTPTSGPWNNFGRSRFAVRYTPPPPPPPPGVPPPPVAGGVFGTANRTKVVSVPRAPDASDFRVRSHIDAVAGILNSLLRLGYIRSLGDGEFAIAGGGISLARPPAATDDVTVGAVVGMTYHDSLNDRVYVCTNNSAGSAVWKLVS